MGGDREYHFNFAPQVHLAPQVNVGGRHTHGTYPGFGSDRVRGNARKGTRRHQSSGAFAAFLNSCMELRSEKEEREAMRAGRFKGDAEPLRSARVDGTGKLREVEDSAGHRARRNDDGRWEPYNVGDRLTGEQTRDFWNGGGGGSRATASRPQQQQSRPPQRSK